MSYTCVKYRLNHPRIDIHDVLEDIEIPKSLEDIIILTGWYIEVPLHGVISDQCFKFYYNYKKTNLKEWSYHVSSHEYFNNVLLQSKEYIRSGKLKRLLKK